MQELITLKKKKIERKEEEGGGKRERVKKGSRFWVTTQSLDGVQNFTD